MDRRTLLQGALSLFAAPEIARAQEHNLAAVPEPNTPNMWADRWKEKLARVKQGDIDLIMVGDSITHAWDNPENFGVWSAYFESRKAVSLGYSGARTENIIWMLENGEIDGISPKVAVVLIGTNNTDYKHYATANTAEQIADATSKIVELLRAKLPDTKIVLLRIFQRDDLPGAAEVATAASILVSRIADNKDIYYLDINRIFLDGNGRVDKALMPDTLHPNPIGNQKWAEALEPTLEKLMGRPPNSAALPAPKCENDFYDWYQRHDAVKAAIAAGPVDLVFLGDSITHIFGGSPTSNVVRGQRIWDQYYGDRNAVNLGFGYDRTQQLLWRLANGEFERIQPKVAVLMIGTNNLTPHAARGNTNREIIEGISAICESIHSRSVNTQLLLLGIFPRDQYPNTVLRYRIREINKLMANLDGKGGVHFLDIGDSFLTTEGVMLPDATVDNLHPTEKGYGIWAGAIEPTLSRLLKG